MSFEKNSGGINSYVPFNQKRNKDRGGDYSPLGTTELQRHCAKVKQVQSKLDMLTANFYKAVEYKSPTFIPKHFFTDTDKTSKNHPGASNETSTSYGYNDSIEHTIEEQLKRKWELFTRNDEDTETSVIRDFKHILTEKIKNMLYSELVSFIGAELEQILYTTAEEVLANTLTPEFQKEINYQVKQRVICLMKRMLAKGLKRGMKPAASRKSTRSDVKVNMLQALKNEIKSEAKMKYFLN